MRSTTELSREDRGRLIEALQLYGPLDKMNKYKGSDRADITEMPGAGAQTLKVNQDTIPLHTLLDANFWRSELYEEQWDWQATMMQPVGGMQRISDAFAIALGPAAIFNAPVTEIARTSKGVRVTYEQKGTRCSIEADYAVCAMPLTILRKVKADLGPDHRRVVNTAPYRSSYKIAWESPRFWETEYNIFGGLSFLSQGPSPVWYPSAGLLSDRGILVAGYMEETVDGFDKLSLPEKFESSRGADRETSSGSRQGLGKADLLRLGTREVERRLMDQRIIATGLRNDYFARRSHLLCRRSHQPSHRLAGRRRIKRQASGANDLRSHSSCLVETSILPPGKSAMHRTPDSGLILTGRRAFVKAVGAFAALQCSSRGITAETGFSTPGRSGGLGSSFVDHIASLVSGRADAECISRITVVPASFSRLRTTPAWSVSVLATRLSFITMDMVAAAGHYHGAQLHKPPESHCRRPLAAENLPSLERESSDLLQR